MSKRGESYCEPRKKFNNRFSNDNSMFRICLQLLLYFRFYYECLFSGKPNRSNKFDNSHRFPLNKRIRRSNSLETIPVDQSPDNPESRPRKRREVLVKDVEDDDDRYIRNLLPFRGTGKKFLNLIARNTAIKISDFEFKKITLPNIR